MSLWGHGPTAREQRILDMHAENISAADIAAELDVKPGYVKYVVDTLHRPALEDWQTPAAKASGDLVAALRRHHPERCLAT